MLAVTIQNLKSVSGRFGESHSRRGDILTYSSSETIEKRNRKNCQLTSGLDVLEEFKR